MLRELLVDVEVLSTSGDLSVEIDNLEFDSREAKPGTLFFAMRGTQTVSMPQRYITSVKIRSAGTIPSARLWFR